MDGGQLYAATRHAVVTLEQVDATIARGLAARNPERRAALEEAVLFAYANGDRERVSLLGGELAQLVAVGSA